MPFSAEVAQSKSKTRVNETKFKLSAAADAAADEVAFFSQIKGEVIRALSLRVESFGR